MGKGKGGSKNDHYKKKFHKTYMQDVGSETDSYSDDSAAGGYPSASSSSRTEQKQVLEDLGGSTFWMDSSDEEHEPSAEAGYSRSEALMEFQGFLKETDLGSCTDQRAGMVADAAQDIYAFSSDRKKLGDKATKDGFQGKFQAKGDQGNAKLRISDGGSR